MLIWEVATANLVEVPLLISEVATTYLFLLHNVVQLARFQVELKIPKLDRVWQQTN